MMTFLNSSHFAKGWMSKLRQELGSKWPEFQAGILGML